MNFPKIFLNRMESLLGARFPEFLDSLNGAPFRALRLNPLKCTEAVKNELTSSRSVSPFCKDSYYLKENEKIGNSPYHHAGAFYLQEPSASSAVEALSPGPYEIVLDLCSAPGGKATQIAGKLDGKGLVWCNEYVTARAQALLSNLERLGVNNAVVSSLSANKLADCLGEFFDKILVDAPCSGEGMMRKEAAAVTEWSEDNIKLCAARQQEILDCAANMLKPGGHLCYSTCTFAIEENELQIADFLNRHPDFELVPIKAAFGQDGFAKLSPNTKNLHYTRRILPCHGGEGHFVALLKKEGDSKVSKPVDNRTSDNPVFDLFYKENFQNECPGNVVTIGERVYITTNYALPDCPVIRNGILAGSMQKGRFVPSHGLFTTPACLPRQSISLKCGDPLISAFLHGEEIPCGNEYKGYCGVFVDGVPLGFGKASGGRLKNHYPKGLRIL